MLFVHDCDIIINTWWHGCLIAIYVYEDLINCFEPAVVVYVCKKIPNKNI